MRNAIVRNGLLAAVMLITLSASGWANDVAVDGAANDASAARWAERTLRKMSLEEKTGQLIMPWAKVEFMNIDGPEYRKLHDEMQKFHLGSFAITSPLDGGLLLKGSPLDAAALINQLQHDSPLPLLFAADFERGLPMRFHGGTVFPHAMAVGATGNPEYAYEFGRITAAESRAIGIHWNFYPDADVNSNPNNPIINTRAFGEDPAEVSAMVRAFINGAHDGHGMATAKHFPGHGDTDTDSHLAVSRINGTRPHLDQVDMAPFRAAIAEGVDAVMVGHLLVPALEPDANRVASLSYNISTRLLQDELGFRGIVITDAMDMNGVTRIFGGNNAQSAGCAAVEALKAGADVILIPGDVEGAYNGVIAAVRSGEIPESRIDESAGKMLRAKAALGLEKNRFVDLGEVNANLNRPENVALGQRIADEAVTVVRGGRSPLLPLPLGAAPAGSPFAYHAGVAAGNHLLLLIFTDDVRGENGRLLAREVRSRVPDVRIIYIDDVLAPVLSPHVLEAAVNAERVVAAVYAIPSAGKITAGESPALERGPASVLANVIKAAANKTVVVAMGNPYLIEQNPGIQSYVCTYSNATVSELSAAKFLFGEIPARGHLPVTIPGVAARVPMGQAAPAATNQQGNR